MSKLVKDMTPEEIERKRAANLEAVKRYQEKNKEKIRERQRRYHKANREKLIEYSRKYSEANKEKISERKRKYREANKEKLIEYSRNYREANKEKVREIDRKYRKENKEKVRESKRKRYHLNKEYSKEKNRKYREANKEKVAELQRKYREANKEKVAEYHRKYRKENKDPNRSIAATLRGRFSHAFRGNAKTGSGVADLGISIDEFRVYIEKQFDEFMTWENRGSYWQFDHIYPLDKANLRDRVEFLAVANWRNYQPLEAGENLRKSNKVTPKARRIFESLKEEFAS